MTGGLQSLLSVGVGQARVDITDRIVFKSSRTPSVTASYQLSNSGDAVKNGVTVLEHWLKSGSAGDYDVRATQTSGDTIAGTLGAWLNLASPQTWSVTTGVSAEVLATMLVEIRDAVTLVVLDSATITLHALEVEGPPGGGGP